MVLEAVAVIAVVIFAVLAAAVIQTQLKLQKTLAEVRCVLGAVQQEIPVLAANFNSMAQAVSALSMEARHGIGQASGFLRVVEDAGERLTQIQRLMFGKGDGWYTQARDIWAGVRAASSVLLEQFH